jgi:DNA modification methylase
MRIEQRSHFIPPVARPLSVRYCAISDLKADPKNARVHSASQVRRIADSVSAFGFNVPVLVDANNGIVAGHGRVLAAKRLGLSEVPTIALDHLNEAQRRAFMIADNRLAEIATWDDHLLGEQLKEVVTLDLDFAIEATGFEMSEIDLRIEALDERKGGADEPPIPVPTGPAITRPGDLWMLGPHRLLCGDALDAQGYRLLFEGRKAAMTFADPPYNVRIDGHVSGLGQIKHREFAMAVGEMTPQAFTTFLANWIRLAAQSSRKGALIYACIDWRHLGELLDAAKSNGLGALNLCVWAKPNPGMGSFYRSQHELVYVFAAPGGPHRNNIQLGAYGRSRSNVWAYAAGPGFGRAGEEGRLSALHPTVKPVAMVADAILDCTAIGEIVLDPFLGSGATLMAAERTRRRCFGLELDPLYCDVIVRRWQSYGGGVATLVSTGDTFDSVANARHALRSRAETGS